MGNHGLTIRRTLAVLAGLLLIGGCSLLASSEVAGQRATVSAGLQSAVPGTETTYGTTVTAKLPNTQAGISAGAARAIATPKPAYYNGFGAADLPHR